MLVLSGDPGGAAAIAPVVQQLQSKSDVRVAVYAYRHAVAAFHQRGMESTELDQSATRSELQTLLAESTPDVVLASTSVNGFDLEKILFAEACRQHVPSLAVLDFWSNYRARFLSKDGRLSLPTRIAVMDSRAAEQMQADGIPRDRAVVTGQPAFDSLLSVSSADRQRNASATRSRLSVRPDEYLIAYMSQPLQGFQKVLSGTDSERGTLPYDEKTVFADLQNAVKTSSCQCRIVIKPHPRELPESWIDTESAICTVDQEISSHDLAVAANVVVGMTSVILVESALLGSRVISLQPGATPADNPLAGFDSITTCNSLAELQGQLFREQAAARLKLPANATQRVVEELLKLARLNGQSRVV